MRTILLFSLMAAPAAAWQAPIDASLTGSTNIYPATINLGMGGARAGASDDFNRADGTDMGPDWTETGGDMSIISNTGYGSNSGNSYMAHNSASDPYEDSTTVIDFLPRVGGPGVAYVALISGYDSATGQNVFIKIQDNTSDGTYDRVFFYKNLNGGGTWNSAYYFDLATPTTSGRVQLTFINGGDEPVLDIDVDGNGTWDEQFTCPGLLSAGIAVGTEFGIGVYNQGCYDNWSVNAGGEPGVKYCFGDIGSGTPCPCGNDNDGSVPESGCANGVFASGAQLTGSGTASVAGDTLVLATTGLEPNNAGLYFQANNDLSPGQIWGDGLQCAGGSLKRLGVRFADGSGYSDTSGYGYTISAKAGNVLAGDTKYYQCWYRNIIASPCGNDFNASSGYAVIWTP